jgi:hypothetical protein
MDPALYCISSVVVPQHAIIHPAGSHLWGDEDVFGDCLFLKRGLACAEDGEIKLGMWEVFCDGGAGLGGGRALFDRNKQGLMRDEEEAVILHFAISK